MFLLARPIYRNPGIVHFKYEHLNMVTKISNFKIYYNETFSKSDFVIIIINRNAKNKQALGDKE